MNSRPSSWLRRLAAIVLVLGGLSLVALTANLVVFSLLYPTVVAFDPLPGWTDPVMNGVVGTGFLIIAIFHVVALGTMGWQIKALQRGTALRAFLVGLGVISLLLVAGNFPLLGDIGNEYKVGLETNSEWRMVFINQGVHFVFIVFGSLCVRYTNRILEAGGQEPEPVVRDEAVFLTALQIGIFSGVLGLVLVAMIVLTGTPARFVGRAIIVLSTIIVAPCALATAGWLFLKRGQARRDWLDEKQSADIGNAALTTLLVASPLLGLGYVLQRRILVDLLISELWFPLAAYVSLLVFSSAAVWYSRRT